MSEKTRAGFTYLDPKLGWKEKHKRHPQNLAWDKCCGDKNDCMCAYRRYPKDDKSGFRGVNRTRAVNRHYDGLAGMGHVHGQTEERPFWCEHRVDEDGFTRLCAGWKARLNLMEKK